MHGHDTLATNTMEASRTEASSANFFLLTFSKHHEGMTQTGNIPGFYLQKWGGLQEFPVTISSSKISPRAVREALSSLPKSNFSIASWQGFWLHKNSVGNKKTQVEGWSTVSIGWNFCLVECLCWPVLFARYILEYLITPERWSFSVHLWLIPQVPGEIGHQSENG